MQLTRFTDYSLKVLLHLGRHAGERVTIREVAEAYDISRNHLMKVVSFLTRQGYLISRRGPGGGIELRRAPAAINIAQVVLDTETDMFLIDGMNPAHPDRADRGLEAAFNGALEAFLDALGQHSLADLLEPADGATDSRRLATGG